MPDPTLNVGGIKVEKKTAAIVVIGVGGIFLIGWYRNKQAAKQQQASVDQAGQSQMDPSTGFPYGSAEDAAALQAQLNYSNPYAYNSSSYAGGQVIGYTGSGSPVYGPGNTGSFTSNAQWSQYVESYLEQNEGADPTTVGNAIGKYITGQPLTADMIQVVQNAIAIGGYPPVAGPNGNPPNYVTANQPTGGGGNPPPPTGILVPNVVALRLADATGALTAAGLKIGGAKQIKGVSQVVTSQNPSAGTSVQAGSTVMVTAKKV
jgi:PASTA domain-containing protein